VIDQAVPSAYQVQAAKRREVNGHKMAKASVSREDANAFIQVKRTTK
jgi:hypothetical protein